jgi:transposase
VLTHPDGKPRRTWAFVMTLCHSRHQYVEFVWDQSSATWLGCHRRAFEWFDGVSERVIIDNAKCAIIKACSHDPLVQRAYAECAEEAVGLEPESTRLIGATRFFGQRRTDRAVSMVDPALSGHLRPPEDSVLA